MQLTSLLGNNTKHLSELKQNVIRPLLQRKYQLFLNLNQNLFVRNFHSIYFSELYN